ncbi:hypothetical protein [Olivibacter oleidegradans]|uniref:HEPN domain-containing protein n=1 Tax=Olivibacter oleidegradans TaxID=760123 RepID=A0ABV6HMU6_9SPHI
MHHIEYRKAAARHLTTCQHLLKDIKDQKADKKNKLLLNIYYLSGYVIETALSYAFFSHIKHTGHVEECTYYKEGFKTHTFDVKVQYILKVNGDLSSLPFVRQQLPDRKLNLLYKSWKTDFRYCYNDQLRESDLTEDLIYKYLYNIEIFLETILKRF